MSENNIKHRLVIDLIQTSFKLEEYNTIQAKKKFLAELIIELKPYYFLTVKKAVKGNIELENYIDKLLIIA